jgi:hypothetical protein
MPFLKSTTAWEVRTMHLDADSRLDLGRERINARIEAAEHERLCRASAIDEQPARPRRARLRRRLRRLAWARALRA